MKILTKRQWNIVLFLFRYNFTPVDICINFRKEVINFKYSYKKTLDVIIQMGIYFCNLFIDLIYYPSTYKCTKKNIIVHYWGRLNIFRFRKCRIWINNKLYVVFDKMHMFIYHIRRNGFLEERINMFIILVFILCLCKFGWKYSSDRTDLIFIEIDWYRFKHRWNKY